MEKFQYLKTMIKKDELKNQLQSLGLKKNMKILLHVALSKVGYLENGPKDLIDGIEEIISPDGILVMPAYNTYGNYKPNLSIVNDYFKNQKDVIRTNQIIASFAVWGNQKEKIAANIEYTEDGLSFEAGEKSTLARLYENDGWSLFLGTDYSTCTILHLAENRASWPSKFIFTEEFVSSDGKKIPFHDVAYQDEDFNEIGLAFEKQFKGNSSILRTGKIANTECKLINQKAFVDFAVSWMNKNRT